MLATERLSSACHRKIPDDLTEAQHAGNGDFKWSVTNAYKRRRQSLLIYVRLWIYYHVLSRDLRQIQGPNDPPLQRYFEAVKNGTPIRSHSLI